MKTTSMNYINVVDLEVSGPQVIALDAKQIAPFMFPIQYTHVVNVFATEMKLSASQPFSGMIPVSMEPQDLRFRERQSKLIPV